MYLIQLGVNYTFVFGKKLIFIDESQYQKSFWASLGSHQQDLRTLTNEWTPVGFEHSISLTSGLGFLGSQHTSVNSTKVIDQGFPDTIEIEIFFWGNINDIGLQRFPPFGKSDGNAAFNMPSRVADDEILSDDQENLDFYWYFEAEYNPRSSINQLVAKHGK